MKSIRLKLWMGMMGLAVVVLLLLWLFQIVFLGSFYAGMRIREIEDKAAQTAASINLDVDGKTAYTEILDAFSYNNNLNVEITDSRGVTLYESLSGTAGMQMPMKQSSVRNELATLLATGSSFRITVSHPRFGNKYILIGSPITGEGGEVAGAMLTGFALSSVEDTVSILKVQLLYITFALIIASVVISLILSRSFTKPILEIKAASEKMASGDYTARISRTGGDELGSLAASVNNLGEQLQKIEQLRKDLIANVSHELRTPLSIIRGYAETIRDVSGDQSEKRGRQLGIIIEETERLSRIVDDILNLSQLQSGYFQLEMGNLSVKRILDGIAERYLVVSDKTGIRLETLLDSAGDFNIKADEARIGQVFYNLISNAFNHTPAGGIITVRAMKNGNEAVFEVSDTGSGIAEADLPYIWDRYYKADRSRAARIADSSGTENVGAAGAGLGLAIVKGLLEAHRAAFGVRSKPGEGTTFWFVLKIPG